MAKNSVIYANEEVGKNVRASAYARVSTDKDDQAMLTSMRAKARLRILLLLSSACVQSAYL